jgi:hypothetical protein
VRAAGGETRRRCDLSYSRSMRIKMGWWSGTSGANLRDSVPTGERRIRYGIDALASISHQVVASFQGLHTGRPGGQAHCTHRLPLKAATATSPMWVTGLADGWYWFVPREKYWLLVADLFWKKSTASWWLISQANRAVACPAQVTDRGGGDAAIRASVDGWVGLSDRLIRPCVRANDSAFNWWDGGGHWSLMAAADPSSATLLVPAGWRAVAATPSFVLCAMIGRRLS